jgi:hypothetical protein
VRHWNDWIPPDKSGPKLTPIFGCNPFGADTRCDHVHHGPIPRGSRCCCMVCHQSGLDHIALPGRIDTAGAIRSEAEIRADARKQKTKKAGVRRVTVNVDHPNLN